MQVKTDFTGLLNADAAPQKLQPMEYINLENLRIGDTTDIGKTLELESVGGTNDINNPYLTELGCICVGSCEDKARSRMIYLVWAPSGEHFIFCCTAQKEIYTVLRNDQVKGGLRLDKDRVIHSMGVTGDLLFWVDGPEEQKRLNIEAGIKLNHPEYKTAHKPYTTPLKQENITLIRRAPQWPLECQKRIGADIGVDVVQNFIRDMALQFCYYYVFRDFETSVTSTRSLLFNYNAASENFDAIEIKIPYKETIDQDVYEIYLVAHNKESNKYFTIKKWGSYNTADSSEIWAHNAGEAQLTYVFKGDYFGAALDDVTATKLFEAIPVQSETLEIAKDRLFLGNNLVGYDTPDVSSLSASVMTGGTGGNQTVDWYNHHYKTTYTFANGTKKNVDINFKFFYLTGPNAGRYSIMPAYEGPLIAEADFNDLVFIGRSDAEMNSFLIAATGGLGAVSQTTPIRSYTNLSPEQITVLNVGAGNPEINSNQTVAWQVFSLTVVSENAQGGDTFYNTYNYYVFKLEDPKQGYYTIPDFYPGAENLTKRFAEITYIGQTRDNIATYFYDAQWGGGGFGGAVVDIYGDFIGGNYGEITITEISTGHLLSNLFFKTDSSYKVSISFYDAYQRKCGIVEAPGSMTVPARRFAYDSYPAFVQWTLVNSPDMTREIPKWATHYQILITRSKNINFFMQGVATNYRYVKKDKEGKYNFDGVEPGSDYAGLGIDLSELLNSNQGYSRQDKDIVILYIQGQENTYSDIIAVEGNWLIVGYKNLGTINTNNPSPFIYEIRSPRLGGEDDVFYEISQCYAILDPKTQNRQYSVLKGSIRGDAYLITRKIKGIDYLLESVSPSDKHPLVWFTDAGRPNKVDRIGQKWLHNNIAFSNVYVPGTKVNGLSSFDALDVDTVPAENGPVYKLKLTSKTQDAGTIMLAICAHETTSIYLGEAQLVDQTGNAYVARAQGVIGTMNTLKGSWGTTNPESVVDYRGNVFWFDAASGDFISYSANGLRSVTTGRLSRYARLFAEAYKAMYAEAIDRYGDRPFVIGGVDPYHREILWSVPWTNDSKIVLGDTDYVGPNPYDFWDNQGKTVVLKLARESQFFMGSYTFTADSFCQIGNRLFSFKKGKLYEHNSTLKYSSFYGEDHAEKVTFIVNDSPSVPKVLNSVAVEANRAPEYTHFRTEYPDEQSSDLVDTEYDEKEGIFYATAKRDRLSPNADGDPNLKLHTGDSIRGTYIMVFLMFRNNQNPLQLKAVNCGFEYSRGHRL